MTTIVFVEKPTGVVMAWDSKVSAGYTHQELDQEKVFQSQGIWYGVAGDVSIANIIETMDVKPPSKDMLPREQDLWVTRTLIPRMRKLCSESSPFGQYRIHAQILVAFNGRVYEIGGDYSRVRNKSGMYAIGSGTDFAIAALQSGKTPREAVEVAAANDSGTGHGIKEAVAS